ncbi:armadillo-type protein [Daedaleopsis nitida]|nr:armadillo-type protein [Daedaleopsis nitida]
MTLIREGFTRGPAISSMYPAEVLSSLHERFDKHLAQADDVRSFFVAANDEVFENRVTAVTVIGRLAMHNPAYVMPSLRKALIQLLTELEYSTVTRNREDCTRLLTLLVNATQRLIKPYSIPMLRVLLPKAYDTNPTVLANILMCLGELSCVGGEAVLPHVPDLMQVIMAKLADPSLQKRDAALHTLGQLCSSTGYVIAPLIEYPRQLLQILSQILRTELSQTIKSEEDAASEESSTLVSAASRNLTGASTTTDDYYQTVAINALLNVLKDQFLGNHRHNIIEAIMSIFQTQGLKYVNVPPSAFAAEDLFRCIEYAITSTTAPSELVHILLNLAEYTEHEQTALSIEHRTLCEYAMKLHAYAKALHYKVLESSTEASPNIIEALISIDSKLQQHDAAWGLLLIAREQYDIDKYEKWYERLAFKTYEECTVHDPGAPDIALGPMKCLHALGEKWDQLATKDAFE